MSATVFSFRKRRTGPQPWTNDELAELYRVVDILARAGLAVETETGLSDEGDPWFIFCRADTGDVIAHFARIDDHFVAASVVVDATYRGANFRQIVERMVSSQPLILPKPVAGTNLLLHPAVILTAFVATALAHSEKVMAADGMRPVEAKWDHSAASPADGHAAKATKISWIDTLQGMLRGHHGDTKTEGDHDGASSGTARGENLASLIAIAIAAMQPVVDKLTAITDAVIAEVEGIQHNAAIPAHVDTSAVTGDLPVVDQSEINSGGAIVVRVDPQVQEQVAKKDVVDAAAVDQQKQIADSHLTSPQQQQAPVQKAPVADDGPHHAAPVDSMAPEAAPLVVSVPQKVVAAASVVDVSSHTDSTDVGTVWISLKDVSSQALQVFSIHLDNSAGASNATQSAPTVTASDSGNTGAPVIVAGTAQAVVTQPASTLVTQPVNTTIQVTGNNSADIVQAIASYAGSSQHNVTLPVGATSPLQGILASYADASHSVKVVVFESTNPVPDVFAFAPGVVFVDESHFAQVQGLETSTSHLVIDLTNGGVVTLVGTATVSHLPQVLA